MLRLLIGLRAVQRGPSLLLLAKAKSVQDRLLLVLAINTQTTRKGVEV